MAFFVPGSMVERREVLHGQVWLRHPVRVVHDDADLLAVWTAEGTPLTFPPHPFGPHPWSGQDRWRDTGVLQLHRPADAYSVWAFFEGVRRRGWYINFQEPFHRQADGFSTCDHGLDIVLGDDGWQYKDVEDVAAQVATGRLTQAEAGAVWAAAQRVAAALDRGERWWTGWEGWVPDDG